MHVSNELLLSAHPQLGQKLIDICIRSNVSKKKLYELFSDLSTAKARCEGIRICVESAIIKEANGIKTQLETFKDKMVKAEDEVKMLEQAYINAKDTYKKIHVPLNLVNQTLSIKLDPLMLNIDTRDEYMHLYDVYIQIYNALTDLIKAQAQRDDINNCITQIMIQKDNEMEIKLAALKNKLIIVEDDILSKYAKCEIFAMRDDLYQ